MIETILNDSDLTEILIQSSDSVWGERNGRLEKINFRFSTALDFHNFIQTVLTEARLRPDLETPFADGTWRGYRVHYVQPPLTLHSPTITLRRRSPCSWNLQDLRDRDWAPADALVKIEKLIDEKKPILIVGATGSGKTSVLSALLRSEREKMRSIILEDTDEIAVPNDISVKLLTRQTGTLHLPDYGLETLVKQSLRMRPDRIVMGEVRGGEAKDLLLAFSTGHGGGMATLHAENERVALLRLEMLIQMGAPQWSLATVRRLIQTGLSTIMTVGRKNEKRQLMGISRISSLEDSGFCLESIYKTKG